MQPEGSLPHSKQPATCPCSEPDQSSPQSTPLLKNPFKYNSPIYNQVFRVISFPQVSPPKPRMHLAPYALHAPSILSFLT